MWEREELGHGHHRMRRNLINGVQLLACDTVWTAWKPSKGGPAIKVESVDSTQEAIWKADAWAQDLLKRPQRLPGHKLTVEWSGEYGEESSSTGTCPCGWTESASSQKVVRWEYGWHLDRMWENILKEQANGPTV